MSRRRLCRSCDQKRHRRENSGADIPGVLVAIEVVALV